MSDIFLKDQEIQDIFKSHIKIEPNVMAIETLFANTRRQNNTVYDPYYQRNYVWDNDKATYFIESILLGTEIPPLVFFNTGKHIEVIDGRQRFETIKRFLEKQFHLTNTGLSILKNLRKKNFDDLEAEIRELFWDTKLRIIEFSVVNEPRLDDRKEDLIKKEIFRRYNSGITPLKHAEVAKAIYINDNLTSYFKKQFKNNHVQLLLLLELFLSERAVELVHKSATLDSLMEKIRTLLVLHKIPINYYSNSNGRNDVIRKLFDNLSDNCQSEVFYNDFNDKVQILSEIRNAFIEKGYHSTRLVYECLFWALTIIENEGIDLKVVKQLEIQHKLIEYLHTNIKKYNTESSHFYKNITERYQTTAKFFEMEFGLDFDLYLSNKGRFKEELDKLNPKQGSFEKLSELESLRLNKPDASTTTIEDICRQMLRGRFLVRPSYQRGEAINRAKSSAIIESILLGIKLPPIFVYKRIDGISEVIDGQQRLLSILGFIGKEFTDENGNNVKSEKNLYSLSKLTILNELNGKRFADLSEELQDKIYDFNISVVNIDEKNNPHFDPIDLFIRLNNKPYPIRDNTFEMWNSYIDKETISLIKGMTQKQSAWFHLLINNNRMENEEMYTALAYLDFNSDKVLDHLDIYQVGTKINSRVKDKADITRLLNQVSIDETIKSQFLKSIKNVESYIKKVKMVLIDQDTETDINIYLKTELDNLFNPRARKYSRRTLQNFYVLWYILNSLNLEMIKSKRISIKDDLRSAFEIMRNIPERYPTDNALESFKQEIELFWAKYKYNKRSISLTIDEKKSLIKQQNNICPICKSLIFIGDEVEVDHINPLACGGRDSFLNLQITHKSCNRSKGVKVEKGKMA